MRGDVARAEDAALDAAYADSQHGLSTIVLAQTSNDHLDELNARYQAIRRQHGELGDGAVAAPGRPYGLHPGDRIQIRRTISHPGHGPLRNGTAAVISAIDSDASQLELTLPTGDRLALSIGEATAAQLRLAYVQHPFPAQGITTDTAHLIVSGHASREGTYVALTRAREETHLYTGQAPAQDLDSDRLQVLAERLSGTESDVPSIAIPLGPERRVTAPSIARELTTVHSSLITDPHRDDRPAGPLPITAQAATSDDPEEAGTQEAKAETDLGAERELIRPSTLPVGDQATDSRRWPRRIHVGPDRPALRPVQNERERAPVAGWET
jgi:hypothetical protein